MLFHITKFGGFPFPGPAEGLVLKVALAAGLQIRFCWRAKQEHGDKGTNQGQAQGRVGHPEAEPRPVPLYLPAGFLMSACCFSP